MISPRYAVTAAHCVSNYWKNDLLDKIADKSDEAGPVGIKGPTGAVGSPGKNGINGKIGAPGIRGYVYTRT